LKVLIACSYSGFERDAFRARGHDAWSCDLIDGEGDTTHHIKDDVFYVLAQGGWDLMIGHPPCTFLSNSGVRWLYDGRDDLLNRIRNEERWENMRKAAEFFNHLWAADVESVVLENPVMHGHGQALLSPSVAFGRKQTVQPWWFGDPFFKATCHWRRGKRVERDLVPTRKLTPPAKGTPEYKAWSAVHLAPPGPERWKDRSRAFPGLCAAEAAQWGGP
jgi:hypothetical protein